MAKEVILMNDVPELGREGDVVTVADGYARNYLLPKNLAAPLTAMTRRQLERKREEREKRMQEEQAEAQALAKKLADVSLTVPVKTGPEGKMFGSVSVNEVIAELEKQGINVTKSQVDLPEAIRELGVFKVPVKLHSEVQAEVKLWIVEE